MKRRIKMIKCSLAVHLQVCPTSVEFNLAKWKFNLQKVKLNKYIGDSRRALSAIALKLRKICDTCDRAKLWTNSNSDCILTLHTLLKDTGTHFMLINTVKYFKMNWTIGELLHKFRTLHSEISVFGIAPSETRKVYLSLSVSLSLPLSVSLCLPIWAIDGKWKRPQCKIVAAC